MGQTEQFIAEMREKLEPALTEAHELRFDKTIAPSPDDSPEELHQKLLKTRANLDRIEDLYLSILRKQNEQRADFSVLRDAFEDAWNAAAARGRQPEYSSAKEREASYSVAVMQYKIDLRRKEKIKAEVDFLVEYLKVAQRGLDGLRRDIDGLIRARTMALSLER